MSNKWDKYAVEVPTESKWDKYAVKNENINTTGKTWSKEDFIDQELVDASNNPKKAGFGFTPKQFYQDGRSAFELAIEHPETLMGRAISPQQIEQTTGGDFADIYRRANLPGSNSTNIAGQMIPQIVGGVIDPMNILAGVVATPALGVFGKGMANNPATRRFLQTQLPSLSKGVLKNNPMAPIYKVIDGIERDITKPLPPKAGKLVQQGQKLVNSVQETMSNLGEEYGKTLKPFYNKKVNVSSLPQQTLEDLGLVGKGIKVKEVSIEKLWKTRWDLMKQVGNPWQKEELLKKTSLKEDEIVNLLERLKATVLNGVDKDAREKILKLDPVFKDAIESGKGLLRMAHNPETGKVNTIRLINAFKNKSDEGSRELFKRFGYYDNRVNEVSKAIKHYNNVELAKKLTIGAVGLAGTEQFLWWKWKQGLEGVSGGGGQ